MLRHDRIGELIEACGHSKSTVAAALGIPASRLSELNCWRAVCA